MAEREGFEPSIRFWRILTFQASAFDHSATAPQLHWKARPSLDLALSQACALWHLAGMARAFGSAPSLGEIDALARAALARLPQPFAAHLAGVRLVVEDFADAETLAVLGIEDAFELTGLYEGVPVGDKHSAPSGTLPDRIRLFRSPILDEWIARGDESLEHLVAHVLVHEVGHHFGLSDAQIEALEAEAD